jgi:hypothetical protein
MKARDWENSAGFRPSEEYLMRQSALFCSLLPGLTSQDDVSCHGHNSGILAKNGAPLDCLSDAAGISGTTIDNLRGDFKSGQGSLVPSE